MAETRSRMVQVFAPGSTLATGSLIGSPAMVFSQVRTFIADEAITVGDVLELDWAGVNTLITAGIANTATEQTNVAEALQHVRITDTVAAGAKGYIGVALESVASGAEIRVCTGGYCPLITTTGDAVAAGDYLTTATAGTAILYASGTHTAGRIIGFALSDDDNTGNYCAAWLYPTCP